MTSVLTRTSRLKRALQALGRLHQQVVLLDDFTTDKIRQSAVGKRDMRAALEHDDLAVLAEPSRAGRRTRPAGDAADDDKASRSAFCLDGAARRPEVTVDLDPIVCHSVWAFAATDAAICSLRTTMKAGWGE